MTAIVEQEQLLTEVQLEERWQMNASHLRYWRMKRAAGDTTAGPAFVKLGRSVRYRMSDIIAFEQENLT